MQAPDTASTVVLRSGLLEHATSRRPDSNAVSAGDNDRRRDTREQAVVHDAHGVLQLLACSHRVLDGRCELQVHDVVSVVGDRRLVAVKFVVGHVAQAQDWLASCQCWQLGDLPHGVLVAEGDDFHRHREAGAEASAHLGLVHDDNELLRAHLHDLLSEQSTTAALHEVELGINLVCAVDGHVDIGVGVQGRQGDAQGLRLLLGADGCRDGDDVLQLSTLQLLAHTLNCKRRCRACSKADDRAALDIVVHGFVADQPLQLILGRGPDHGRPASALCTGGRPRDRSNGGRCDCERCCCCAGAAARRSGPRRQERCLAERPRGRRPKRRRGDKRR
mmetsp:Transcript_35931/g.92857  ORF Transcript_35931/g.92857 Transcript_35931/m.92857 type:complete len:333 (+) Transcript_35931:78-1076(+)